MMQRTILGTAFNGSAIFDDEGLRDNGTVNQEVVCILEYEGIGGEFLPFFDRNGRIGTDMQICANVTAAKGDDIVSVAFHKEASDIKSERVMRDDEQTHDLPGFKLLENDMTVFFSSVRKIIPLTDIFRDDGYKSVIFSNIQSTDFAGIGEATKIRTIFRYLICHYPNAFFVKLFLHFFQKKLAEGIEVEVGMQKGAVRLLRLKSTLQLWVVCRLNER